MNRSDEFTVIQSARCAGVNDGQGGRAGCLYYPAIKDAEGKTTRSARCVVTAYINRKSRRDPQTGDMIEGRREILVLTGWNTRNSQDGKGLADVLAKCMSEGKEFSCRAKVQSYEQEVTNIDGSVIQRSDGQGPLTQRRYGWVIEPGTLMLGEDSEKVTAAEIQAFNGDISFHSRPQFWNSQGHSHNTAWKEISKWRMAQVYVPGQPTYGYASVRTGGTGAATVAPGINAQAVKAAADNSGALKLNYPGGSVIPQAGAVGADDEPF